MGSEVVSMDIGHPGKSIPFLLSKVGEAQRSGLKKALCGDSSYPDGLTDTFPTYIAGEVPHSPNMPETDKV